MLKKAEGEIIKTKTQKDPTILLDDIFAKLDNENIEKTLSLFRHNAQTIITHTEKTPHLSLNQIKIND